MRCEARLIGADRLYAVEPAFRRRRRVAAKDTVVLVDADTASWSSWNRYGEQFARETGAERYASTTAASPARRSSTTSAGCGGR